MPIYQISKVRTQDQGSFFEHTKIQKQILKLKNAFSFPLDPILDLQLARLANKSVLELCTDGAFF